MTDDVQLVSDGDGLAIIGEADAIERFIAAERLESKTVALPGLGSLLGAGADAAQAGSALSANSGRWMKLTEESAQLIEKHGLRETSKGVKTGVVNGQKKGQVGGFVEFVKTPRSLLTNPAALAGVAGIMAQAAMQQSMSEITSYLERIDEKVDDVLRGQKDAVLADMVGADLVLREALTIREHGGRVNEVTWSKAQGTASTIARTQAYALRQLETIAEQLEREGKVGDLAESSKLARAKTREWLAILARCFQLHDAMAVLELDRVLDAAPADLDGHRLGLRAARSERMDAMSLVAGRLVARMDDAAGTANTKVLRHPAKSPSIVIARNDISGAVDDFYEVLGTDSHWDEIRAKRWSTAAAEVGARALEVGAGGVDGANKFRAGTVSRGRSVKGRLANRMEDRPRRRRKDDQEG
ncbi:hypothetical protein IFT73_04140 [Aeromicrobium sp. CFBP 8757]|uniref:hypothetical protein n=1 Tax=Aeromicrobium sp. CFBP 8757 TaxID=2775288 RepID=UPI00177F1463|nr:hypothetical protein [Aeromicrobium sp. CFBP 8757]MBD8606034.1 hypothetical protein [Aeromicrobium sp. CFBP 8757]